MRRTPILVVGMAIAAMASAGAVLATQADDVGGADKAALGSTLAAPSPAGFSVFTKTDSAAKPDEEVASIATDLNATAADLQHFQVLADHLGSFQSTLIAFPAMSGRNVCYSLLGATRTDPGMSYCYRPRSPHAPPGLVGERFSVVAPESRTGDKLDVGTQVFGVAEDSVTSLRVLVSGAWRELPIANNGFYVNLPGVQRSEVGTVEATLSDGSKQFHDLQTGE
jgi:hypothetical protein